MMTIVTQVELKDGAEREWDAIMAARMTEAKKRSGWIGGQLLSSEEDPKKRVIVGTWKSRADWEEWHQDPLFAETRRQLDALVNGTEQHGWYDVMLDVRKGRAPARATRSRA
jgi:heme-degrading monooxygenase HmoA